jgi:hypothetical protein
MLKNESARNLTKPTPLRPSRLPNSGGIFTLSNGVRMKKISHSDRKVKQGKKSVDWAVRTGHVAGLYDTWHMTHGRSIQDTWLGP